MDPAHWAPLARSPDEAQFSRVPEPYERVGYEYLVGVNGGNSPPFYYVGFDRQARRDALTPACGDSGDIGPTFGPMNSLSFVDQSGYPTIRVLRDTPQPTQVGNRMVAKHDPNGYLTLAEWVGEPGMVKELRQWREAATDLINDRWEDWFELPLREQFELLRPLHLGEYRLTELAGPFEGETYPHFEVWSTAVDSCSR